MKNALSPLILTLITAGTLTLTACDTANASKATEVDTNETAVVSIPVEAYQSQRGDIQDFYLTTAVLEAKDEASVTAKVSGIVEKVLVDEGDYVEKGQVIATIETERYQLKLKQAKVQLAKSESELKRITAVHKRDLISHDEFDKLKWQVEELKVARDLAALELKETQITAPISGYIAVRYVKQGNVIQQYQKDALFHIVQTKLLNGIVHLPEKELLNVKLNQKAQLSLSSNSEMRVAANVSRISPMVNHESGTFKVTLHVSNPDGRLKSGMFTQVKLLNDIHTDTVLIPRSALISTDNQQSVFIVKDNVAHRLIVQTGYSDENSIEITTGLDAGSTVITAGHQNLKDQANVHVIPTAKL